MTRGAAAGLLCILLAACGPDEVDLTGMYRVDADLSSAPCGMDQPVATPPVALKFARSDYQGTSYFSYQECTDLAGTSCSGLGLFDAAFSEPIDGGWKGVITSASGGGTSCTISYIEQTAVLHGTLLVVESNNYSAQVDNTATLCTPDEADRRNTTMPCSEHARIEATRL